MTRSVVRDGVEPIVPNRLIGQLGRGRTGPLSFLTLVGGASPVSNLGEAQSHELCVTRSGVPSFLFNAWSAVCGSVNMSQQFAIALMDTEDLRKAMTRRFCILFVIIVATSG